MRPSIGVSQCNLFDHSNVDGLEAGQGQQDLAKPTSSLVLPVRDVVFQVDLCKEILKLTLSYPNPKKFV